MSCSGQVLAWVNFLLVFTAHSERSKRVISFQPTSPQLTPITHPTFGRLPYGLLVACLVLSVWAVSLLALLRLDLSKVNPFGIAIAFLWQTFLYTGLFITAHDAMHGVVAPQNPKLNQFFGSLALLLYGLFSFKKLIRTHWQHHQHPASDHDPDFHDGKHANFFAWYFHFMKGYWSWLRLFGLMLVYNVLNLVLHVPQENLNLFWVFPSIASSVQLFYFGTFLPHREPQGGYLEPFRAESIYRPAFWSFITCYHFGYHREHHEFPQVPWWQLPAVSRRNRRFSDSM